GIGRYGIVEKAMMGFGVIMFFGIIALAISVFQGQEAQQVAAGTIVPTFPNTSIITVMSLIGGVGERPASSPTRSGFVRSPGAARTGSPSSVSIWSSATASSSSSPWP